MATARETVKKSLRYMGKETPLKQATEADYNDMLVELNKMLAKWFKLGLRLALTTEPIPTLDAVVPFPDFALEGIEYNLAKDAWPLFNLSEPVSQSVREEAVSSKNDLWSLGRPVPKSVFPGVLPVGSGNEWGSNGVGSFNFYPNCDEPIYPCNKDELLAPSGVPLKGVDNG